MTMHLEELVEAIDQLQLEDLEAWMRQALVQAQDQSGYTLFNEAECARVRLICSLHYDMEVEASALPIVLELVEQLHETRRRLHALGAAVLEQDEDIRSAILSRLETANTEGNG